MVEARVIEGDCLAVLPTLESGSVDAVVTDPPYALVEPNSARSSYAARIANGRTEEDKALRRGGFMGKKWDAALPPAATWESVLETLKPGGYMVAFGGTRTWHRLTCAIEDAGFEIRDTLCWLQGQGFPKGQGCLKPAWEPIVLARKPGKKVLPLGIEECRIPTADNVANAEANGRWPANVVLSHADDCSYRGTKKVKGTAQRGPHRGALGYHGADGYANPDGVRGYSAPDGTEEVDDWECSESCPVRMLDEQSRQCGARFFYCAKASRSERGVGNNHPTVKSLNLMQWLARLACPLGGTVLDPFGGSGTTALACLRENRHCILVEKQPEYVEIARKRIAAEVARQADAAPLFASEAGDRPS